MQFFPLKQIIAFATISFLLVSCGGSKESSAPELPAEKHEFSTIMSILGSNPELTTLFNVIKVAGLEQVMTSRSKVTLLAPTNKAFENLDKETRQLLLKDKNAAKDLINKHIIRGESNVDRLMSAGTVSNAARETLNFANNQVDGANLMQSIKLDNGYIHTIDKVLGL